MLALAPVAGLPKRCSRCGGEGAVLHEVVVRQVGDLPVDDWDSWVRFPRARAACPQGGPTVEAVPWLDREQRMTRRFAEKIAPLAQVRPIQHVATWFGIRWDRVKQVDQRALLARLGPVDAIALAGVRLLAMHAFAIQKGHRYATVIIERHSKRVLWVGRGRSRAEVRPSFELLGPTGCAPSEAVAMGMSGSEADEERAQCPPAAIVYDLFRVAACYGREVMHRVRADEPNRVAPAHGPTDWPTRSRRRVINGARWLMLRNRDHVIVPQDRIRLHDVLAANRALCTGYVLKDDRKQRWWFTYPKAALRFWTQS